MMNRRVVLSIGFSLLFFGLGAVACAEGPDGYVLVKAGTFTMGSPEDEPGRRRNEKEHTVTISRDYYMSKYEVTQGDWEAVMGKKPSDEGYGIGDNYPVKR